MSSGRLSQFTTSTAGRLLGLAVLTLVTLPPSIATAQTVDISGFVKSSYYYDTRQIVGAREGDFVLYPQPENVVDGEDANATDNLLFFPLFSRIAFAVSDVPDVLGSTVTGRIEGDFHGASNALLNSYRIRRAFVKFSRASPTTPSRVIRRPGTPTAPTASSSCSSRPSSATRSPNSAV